MLRVSLQRPGSVGLRHCLQIYGSDLRRQYWELYSRKRPLSSAFPSGLPGSGPAASCLAFHRSLRAQPSAPGPSQARHPPLRCPSDLRPESLMVSLTAPGQESQSLSRTHPSHRPVQPHLLALFSHLLRSRTVALPLMPPHCPCDSWACPRFLSPAISYLGLSLRRPPLCGRCCLPKRPGWTFLRLSSVQYPELHCHCHRILFRFPFLKLIRGRACKTRYF